MAQPPISTHQHTSILGGASIGYNQISLCRRLRNARCNFAQGSLHAGATLSAALSAGSTLYRAAQQPPYLIDRNGGRRPASINGHFAAVADQRDLLVEAAYVAIGAPGCLPTPGRPDGLTPQRLAQYGLSLSNSANLSC